jgi:cysteine synthase B
MIAEIKVENQNTSLTQSLEGMELLKAIGNTPLLSLNRIKRDIPADVGIYGKAEWFNPGGSVKDRPAFNIIRSAVFEGQLLPGMRLLDSTSGNMGIAYATFGAALDIPITLTVPEHASVERISILKALGAEVILTDPLEGSDGALLTARRMAQDQPELFYYANQYDNPANWKAHYEETGPEIFEGTQGQITHFVVGLGTSGTMVGAAQYLKEQNPAIQIVAVQPDSPFHGIEGLKHISTSIDTVTSKLFIPDHTITISTERAYELVVCLAREEGYFVGISSGAAAAAAIEVASSLKTGTVVTIFPDAGYKYLSETDLWKNTRACDDHEKDIYGSINSRSSTPKNP